ncbi:MAG: glycosyltransferase [Phycisphaeraceae bacterium]|nr:glycosyltransferase [Phycisphaeraceae bacterium]
MPDAADLTVVVLCYNRRDAVRTTLTHLAPWAQRSAQIIVVDNASADNTAEIVTRDFPWATLHRLERNAGVAGFNHGARSAERPFILILDDDAWPDDLALHHALELMRNTPGLGGVMLHRLHPETGEWEWPGRAVDTPQNAWPDMGCGNLVRRDAWNAVGGYEEAFFLYRNDTDLALKLLGAGFDVAFNPAWHVLHDSPLALRKNPRWFFLSTRNWVWMCRRHGRRGSGVLGVLLGWLWAHRLARSSPARHCSAFKGLLAGLFFAAPRLPPAVQPDGQALRRLITLKRTLRGGRRRNPAGIPPQENPESLPQTTSSDLGDPARR